MASLSWLARGLAARKSREGPAAPRVEPRGPAAETSRAGRPDSGTPAGPLPAVPQIEKRPAASHEAPKAPDTRAALSVELPLANVLESVPLLFLAGDAEKLVASAASTSAKVKVPLQRVLVQLPSGRIEFRFDDLRPQIPDQYLTEESRSADQGEVPILLDLAQVVNHLPSTALARRDQMEVPSALGQDLPELLMRPEKRPTETPLRETARLAMAASSMPILPGSALGLEPPAPTKTESGGKAPDEPKEIRKEVILPGAVPEAGPGAEPVGPAEPLFVRKTAPKPLFKSREPVAEKQPQAPPKESLVVKPTTQAPATSIGPIPGPIREGRPVWSKPAIGARGDQRKIPDKPPTKTEPVANVPRAATKAPVSKPAFALGSVPVLGVSAPPGPPPATQFRPGPKAKAPGVLPKAIRIEVPAAPIQPKLPSERALAARALARWLGIGTGQDVRIREIPEILIQLPGISGAIISDSEALTVARQLPPGISEEAISSSASLLYKRLRHASGELGGGFTNQTLVGLGQWTLVITFEAPFFLTTVHSSLSIPPRVAMRMRKIARALARLEVARPVG